MSLCIPTKDLQPQDLQSNKSEPNLAQGKIVQQQGKIGQQQRALELTPSRFTLILKSPKTIAKIAFLILTAVAVTVAPILLLMMVTTPLLATVFTMCLWSIIGLSLSKLADKVDDSPKTELFKNWLMKDIMKLENDSSLWKVYV